MTSQEIEIELDRHNGAYSPGELLRAGVWFKASQGAAIETLECSVLWYTVGKGEEDIAVHHFVRVDRRGVAAICKEQPLQIECILPASPLSYDGVIVKVCWCIRARLFLHGGQETVIDAPFRLGEVPAASVVES